MKKTLVQLSLLFVSKSLTIKTVFRTLTLAQRLLAIIQYSEVLSIRPVRFVPFFLLCDILIEAPVGDAHCYR